MRSETRSQTAQRRFFLFSDTTASLSRGRKTAHFCWNALCLLGTSFLLCVMSLLLAYGPYSPDIFWDYFTQPAILLLNWLPILLVQLLLYAICGRQWIAYLITSILFVVASVSNYYKLTLRNDPVVFADLAVMFTAADFAGHYDIEICKRVVAAVLTVPVGTLFLLFFAKGRPNLKGRIALVLAVLLPLYPLWTLVYSQKAVYNSPAMTNERSINRWSDTQQMVSKGLLYSFIYSATKTYEPAPEGYSAKKVEQSLAAFTDGVIPDDKKVNILGVQLEAFADLELLGIPGIDVSAYADYRAVLEQSYHGTLITNIFAGGTIDTERCFLIGTSSLRYYTQNLPTYVRYLSGQGYQTTGSHPCTREFYNRSGVNSYMGFESYYYTENCYGELSGGATADDSILFPEVLRRFKEAMAQGPVFDFTVTYQGHGPYATDTITGEEGLWDGTGYSEEAYCILNNYLSSVKSTAKHLRALTQELSKCEEPVVVIVFGDHKPWLGNDASVYKELGIDFDLATEQGVTNYYGTEYLIWANDAAKKVIGFSFEGDAPTTSPGYLMNILFNTLGWKGPAFMQLSEQVRQTLPVVASTGLFYNQNGLTHELTPQEREILNTLTDAQYYRQRHFGDIS